MDKRENNLKTIYLSGPIMDEHAGAAREWRECAKSLLAGRYRLLDPMRRKFVDREVDSANEIVEFDLLDVRNADIILVITPSEHRNEHGGFLRFARARQVRGGVFAL